MLTEDKLIDMVDSSKEKELRTFETRLQFIKKVFSVLIFFHKKNIA